MELVIESTFLKRLIAETISITTSKAFYGYHRIYHLFFINALPSLHHTMQLLMGNYLEDYRLHIQAYIISKPIHQLLIPTSYFSKSPYQVSSRNLGLHLNLCTPGDYIEELNIWFTESNCILQKNEFPLILAKGEPVLDRRVIKRFFLDPPRYSMIKIQVGKFGIYLKQQCDDVLYLEILAIDDEVTVVHYPDGNRILVDPPLESAIKLKVYVDRVVEIWDKVNIVVVVEFQNYASDIKVWVEFEDREYFNGPVIVAEPLTTTYI